jgi:His-Xaa-Ser system radical SAM maturase HxsC
VDDCCAETGFGLNILTHETSDCAWGDYIVVDDTSEIEIGDVIKVDVKANRLVFLFKRNSHTNSLYVTDLCNSHCLMCPQPPKTIDGVDYEELKRLVSLLPSDVEELGITGGEPTVLGTKLQSLLKQIAAKSPDCYVHVLSNARLFSDMNAANGVSGILKNISFGIPLYAPVAEKHDYIVQSKGAFEETLQGVFNLARHHIPVEIRIVLHKLTVPYLLELAHFIYRNLPFVFQISFMGMEEMGYVKKNWADLWISPVDYQKELVSAVRFLYLRGMNPRVFNLPHCYMDKRLWRFSADSISDFKKTYKKECESCSQKCFCGGLFHYQAERSVVFPFS